MELECNACGKSFSGIVCFQQHERSEKHKKKVRILEMRNRKSTTDSSTISSASATQNQTFYCDVCNISCTGVEKYQIHSQSLEHIHMAMKFYETTMADTSNSMAKQDISTAPYCKDSVMSSETSSVEQINHLLQPKYQYVSVFKECQTCKKTFSGPEPYRLHLESAMHKKKIAIVNNAASDLTDGQNASFNELKCEICNKRFSGPYPYDQHLNSEVHKKKVLSEQLRAKYEIGNSLIMMDEADSSSESAKKMNSDNLDYTQCGTIPSCWYCSICKKECTGPIPYKMHLNGDVHRKNKVKAEIIQCRMNQDSGGKLDAFSNNCDAQHIVGTQTFSINQVGQENNSCSEIKAAARHNTYVTNENVVPSLHDLKLLTHDDLNLTYFQPDEEIKFNCTERGNGSENVPQKIKQDLIQKQNNTEVYQICDICEISLWNKEECLTHYDSKEHFMKKWSLKDF